MECKYNLGGVLNEWNVELIDTLWNVNKQEGKEKINKILELIDTLWNVNTI